MELVSGGCEELQGFDWTQLRACLTTGEMIARLNRFFESKKVEAKLGAISPEEQYPDTQTSMSRIVLEDDAGFWSITIEVTEYRREHTFRVRGMVLAEGKEVNLPAFRQCDALVAEIHRGLRI